MPSRSLPVESSGPAQIILEAVGVSGGYPTRPVLHQIDCRLVRGELLVLIGTNGAGKSTFLKAIMGLVPLSAGSIRFDGQTIDGWLPHERARRGLAYVMQSGSIFPNLTVDENMQAATADLSEPARTEGIESALDVFESLREARGQRAGLLSGGQRQMLALTMILARQPRVLLLDEPCAGLAPDLVSMVLERLAGICASQGTAIFLIEQNVRAALDVAHRAILMERGRITLETARPREWRTSGNLERLLWGAAPEEPVR